MKNHNIFLLILPAILLFSCTDTRLLFTNSSQDVKGKVYMKNGTVYEGIMGLPKPLAKKIKVTPDGKKPITVSSEEVSYLDVRNKKLDASFATKLIYTARRDYRKNGEYKMLNGKAWLLCIADLPAISVFIIGQYYSMDSHGLISANGTSKGGINTQFLDVCTEAG